MDGGEGKSPHWAGLPTVHLVIRFSQKAKWQDMGLYTKSGAMLSGLSVWSGTWKEYDWTINERRAGVKVHG